MGRALPPRAAAPLRVARLGTPSMTRLPRLNWSSARSHKWLIMGPRSIQGVKRGAARFYASTQRLERPLPPDHCPCGVAAPPQKGAPWALQKPPCLQTQRRSTRRRRRSMTQTKPPCNACDHATNQHAQELFMFLVRPPPAGGGPYVPSHLLPRGGSLHCFALTLGTQRI